MKTGHLYSEGGLIGVHQGTGPGRRVEKGVHWLLAENVKGKLL